MAGQLSEDDLPHTIEWYDATLPTPAENLALDEVLLQDVDANPTSGILRTWEPNIHFVVVGRSNHVEIEVDAERCRQEGVPIFRRCSGGGAVAVGPGCLAYALILPLTHVHRTRGVGGVTQSVMEVVAAGLRDDAPGIQVCGTSDLVVNDRKFSGNSQRWLKNAFLHHGTILYDYELPRIERLLRLPSRQPEYRSGRPHGDFVTNIPIRRDDLIRRLATTWNGLAREIPAEVLKRAQILAAGKYESDRWNRER